MPPTSDNLPRSVKKIRREVEKAKERAMRIYKRLKKQGYPSQEAREMVKEEMINLGYPEYYWKVYGFEKLLSHF